MLSVQYVDTQKVAGIIFMNTAPIYSFHLVPKEVGQLAGSCTPESSARLHPSPAGAEAEIAPVEKKSLYSVQ